jgi:hypothetical protein
MVYPALLPLMRTPRLPAVDWTDAPPPPPLRRFKWTRPFRWNTKSGFWACSITFQLASNTVVTEKRHHRRCATREYADLNLNWFLAVTSLTNHALYMDLEECFSLRRVYILGVTQACWAQINTCFYSVFRHTQHNYGSSETSVDLFTGHHQTCTHNNIRKKLYDRPHNLEKELCYFAREHKAGKTT